MPDTAAVSRHVSVVVAAPADTVYTLASDPSRLPEWAAGLAHTPLEQDGDSWFVDAPFGRVRVRFAPPNEFGVVDHVVTMPDGTEVLNPVRVIPLDEERSEVLFTVRHRADQNDEEFASDVEAVTRDLATLRGLVEGG